MTAILECQTAKISKWPNAISLTQFHTCDIFSEPDREIWDFSEGDWGIRWGDFCAEKLFHKFHQKLAFFTLLKTNFFGFWGFLSSIMQLSSGTAIVSKEIICGRLT